MAISFKFFPIQSTHDEASGTNDPAPLDSVLIHTLVLHVKSSFNLRITGRALQYSLEVFTGIMTFSK